MSNYKKYESFYSGEEYSQDIIEYSKIYKISNNQIKINTGRVFIFKNEILNNENQMLSYTYPRLFNNSSELVAPKLNENNKIYSSIEIAGGDFEISENSKVIISIPMQIFSGAWTAMEMCDDRGNKILPPESPAFLYSVLCAKFYELQNIALYKIIPESQSYQEVDEISVQNALNIKIADIILSNGEISKVKQYHSGPLDVTNSIIYYGSYIMGQG